jgi:hypothetical protein
MSSGAFSLFIDQQAGGGPIGAQQRVVPIPPPAESGAVKFTTVAFSLAYDTFGQANAPATVPAIVRVLHGKRGSRYDQCQSRSWAQVVHLLAD